MHRLATDFELYCVNCGKRVVFHNLRQRNNYYETLNCVECLGDIENDSDFETYIDPAIVYKRWLSKLLLVSNMKKEIKGSCYNPLTGEKIEDINEYLSNVKIKE